MGNRARAFVVYLVALAVAAGVDELWIRYGSSNNWGHRIAFMLAFVLVAFLGRRLLVVTDPPSPYSAPPSMMR
jgi:hypothetical protein